ncbi:uncharacterized protein BCR38DRAFT_78331 [Pseudomassariella vexata]|uniref:Uncharacterized protein n=1 Tax=Pseudomassariella vexata TaxID=1141098 RepID=A0A1Y2DGH4_9PEZI|nr:uncharacterized protein BCR38DRAFT_78331 [Pseudomassariella vexata]ORY58216.1 hypothetical protein BCR38DRAFT_78331 [Pseudomassariella vexata]
MIGPSCERAKWRLRESGAELLFPANTTGNQFSALTGGMVQEDCRAERRGKRDESNKKPHSYCGLGCSSQLSSICSLPCPRHSDRSHQSDCLDVRPTTDADFLQPFSCDRGLFPPRVGLSRQRIVAHLPLSICLRCAAPKLNESDERQNKHEPEAPSPPRIPYDRTRVVGIRTHCVPN